MQRELRNETKSNKNDDLTSLGTEHSRNTT